MYRKSLSLLLVLICLALATACKKDNQINAFMNDWNSFTDDLVKKIDSAQNPSDGVDEAQKYFDSRKAEMQDKIKSVKNIGDNQISEDTKKKADEGFKQDQDKLTTLVEKYGSDPAVGPKLRKLLQDYVSLLQTAM